MTTKPRAASRLAGMTPEKIREMLDRSIARAFAIHERAEAARPAELAVLISAPRDTARPRRTISKPRIGHRMRQLHDVVSAVPGCSKRQVMRVAGLPASGPGSGRSLARAIAAGLIVVEVERWNLHRCFASERDRQRWHLRRELLAPGTPVERIEAIRADIERLDAERAATWTEAS